MRVVEKQGARSNPLPNSFAILPHGAVFSKSYMSLHPPSSATRWISRKSARRVLFFFPVWQKANCEREGGGGEVADTKKRKKGKKADGG